MTDTISIILDASDNPLGIATDALLAAYPDLRIANYRRVRGAAMKRGNSEQDVSTPPEFLEAVRKRFGSIAWDMAATEENAVADGCVTPARNALGFPWRELRGLRWCNPPFSLAGKFAEKAAEAASDASRTLLLVPLAAGTKWWKQHVHPHALVLSIGRLQFVGHEHPFPKDLALCVYGSGFTPGFEYWDWRSE